MANKYKRHSTGGRFKQRSASDLGSGAIKTQADIVIDSLKLQQARSSEYASDYVQGMRGVENTEEWNQNLLSKLEDKAFQTRRDAIKVRQKREVESLEGKAKEYGKQAEFWKDFSTTYSKHWGKLAQGAVDLKQRADADQQLTKFYASENWQRLTDIDNPIYKTTIDLINGNKGDPEAQKAILSEVSKLNRFARIDVLAKMKKQVPNLLKNLEAELSKNNIKWNKSTIGAHVQTLSNQIQQQYGLANTREGRALDREMMLKAGTLIKTSIDLNKAEKETKELNNAIQNAYHVKQNIDSLYSLDGELSTKEIERREGLKKKLMDITLLRAYTLTEHAWRTDNNGKVIKGLGNVDVKTVLGAMAEAYSLHDPTYDGIREMIGKMPDPQNPEQTMDQRYKQVAGQNNLDNMAREISSKRSQEKRKKKKELDAQKEAALKNDFILFITNNDINSPEGAKELARLEHATKQYKDLNDQVNAALAFRYNEHNLNSLYESLNRAITNGDIEHMNSIVNYLPEPQKAFYLKAMDKAIKIDEIFPAKALTTAASVIDGKVKSSSLQYGEGELGQMKDLYKTTIRNHARDYLDQNPNASNTKVETYATQMAQDALNSNAGIWRIVRNPSGKGKYAGFLEDETNWVKGTDKYNPKYAGLEIGKVAEKVGKHGLVGFLNLPEHGESWNAMSLDVIDDYLIEVARGENITTNETLELLYKSQLQPDHTGEILSRTDILNKLAAKAMSSKEMVGRDGLDKKFTTKEPRTKIKDSDFDDQDFYIVPYGALDKSEYYTNSSKFIVSNYRQFSPSDQTAIGALLWTVGEDGKLPWSKQLEDIYSKSTELGIPPMELIDGDPNIMNYDYFNTPLSRYAITTERPE